MSSSEFQHYNRDEFLAEFYPDPGDKAAIAAGMEQLRAEQRAFRLAEMRLGITQVQMGITQGRVSAIEHAQPGTTELRTLAAYVEALGGRRPDLQLCRKCAARDGRRCRSGTCGFKPPRTLPMVEP
jgi:hypothetical protein